MSKWKDKTEFKKEVLKLAEQARSSCKQRIRATYEA